MSFDQRRRWIIDWIKKQQIQTVNTMDQKFSDAYIETTNCKFRARLYGAHNCPALASDLLRMHNEGTLVRRRSGISGFAGQGFPKWVWTYEIAPHLRSI